MRRELAITLVLFALVLFISRVRYAPPAPAPRDTTAKESFSAERAREFRDRFIDGSSRWVGTKGNARGRATIKAELEKLGWTVEEQQARSCTYHGLCAPIINLIAKLPGKDEKAPGVLISAHYDSVPVSPGASDDGAGTVTLVETARALAEGPRPKRTIVVLFTDGEEAGLLGADAFVRNHPLAKTVRATVNVDARGSHGPSQMFETSRGNAWIVSLMAAKLDRPVTTSLYYEVYKRMPNDTDFTMTKTIAAGVNFANTSGIEHYHTPLDRVDLADLGTLQHHGDHVLGMTRAFAEAENLGPTSSAEAGKDAVWFDVLALGIVRWPEDWTLLFALIAFALVLGQTIRQRAFDRGLFVFLPSLIAGAGAAFVAGWMLKTGGALPAFWIAHPTASIAAVHLAAASALLAVALAISKKASPRGLWAGTWLGWGIVGIGTAYGAPGVSYLFIIPVAIAAITGSLSFVVTCIAPAVAASLLVLPLALGLYDALGFVVAPLLALPTILLGTTLAPMFAGEVAAHGSAKRIAPGVAIASAACVIVAMIVPKYSIASPERANVVFLQDDKGEARVFIDTSWGPAIWGPPPIAMLNAAGAKAGEASALPWTFPVAYTEVPRLEEDEARLQRPNIVVAIEEDLHERHFIKGFIQPSRTLPAGAVRSFALFFPTGRRVELKVVDRFAFMRPVSGGWVVGLVGFPDRQEGEITHGIPFEMSAPKAHERIDFTLFERLEGVPPKSRADDAVRARPAEATTFQDGDVTVFTYGFTL